ncbi:MAG TPA: glycosyltransferase family 4 protein [Gammaproteobacteria bacterium]
MSAAERSAAAPGAAEPTAAPPARRRLKVLLCAHELSPRQGSECAVGWHVAVNLARLHDVTVLCASGPPQAPEDYRAAVEDYLATRGPIPHLTFVFVEPPRAARLLAAIDRALLGRKGGGGFRPSFYWTVKLWQRAASRKALELEPETFDVVHHVTPIGFWGAGTLWKLGKPYVWGPVSGMGGFSLPFARWLGAKALLFEACRAALNSLRAHASPSLRRAARRAAFILAVGPEEARAMERLGARSVIPMLETAAPPVADVAPRRRDGGAPLRLCWAGQHIDRKALPLLLHALAESRLRDRLELHVVGAGPRTAAWRALAEGLGLENVAWHGQLSREAVLAEMRRAHVLVHTSTREGTPHVVLEAMAQGLPVVCHDVGGMSVAVTQRCGIKVPFANPRRSITGFREALERLAETPSLLETLSAGALQRAAELTWAAKAAEIAAVYARCAGRAEPRVATARRLQA